MLPQRRNWRSGGGCIPHDDLSLLLLSDVSNSCNIHLCLRSRPSDSLSHRCWWWWALVIVQIVHVNLNWGPGVVRNPGCHRLHVLSSVPVSVWVSQHRRVAHIIGIMGIRMAIWRSGSGHVPLRWNVPGRLCPVPNRNVSALSE